MYHQHFAKKSLLSRSVPPIQRKGVPRLSYAPLSSVVQRAKEDSASVSGDEWMMLDRAIGTRATQQMREGKRTSKNSEFKGFSAMLGAKSPSSVPPVQAKLAIGDVNDKYEKEADRVAREVVNEIHSPQVKEEEPESGIVQRKLSLQASGEEGGEATAEWEGALNSKRGGGQPLSPSVREPMEEAFGADFSGVRVHTDKRAEVMARSIQAKAFTTGQDVFFRQGTYKPTLRAGKILLAHELTHVLQQKGKEGHGEREEERGRGRRRVAHGASRKKGERKTQKVVTKRLAGSRALAQKHPERDYNSNTEALTHVYGIFERQSSWAEPDENDYWVYTGKTCRDINIRFSEHCDEKNLDPKDYYVEELYHGVHTPFEAAINEQYYMDIAGGLEDQPLNSARALTRSTFNKYAQKQSDSWNDYWQPWRPKT